MFQLKNVGKFKVAHNPSPEPQSKNADLWNFTVNELYLPPEIIKGQRRTAFKVPLKEMKVHLEKSLMLQYLKNSKSLNGKQMQKANIEVLHYFLSQLYYGEIAAFHISSKILSIVPDSEVKQIMARQVQDELKHVYILDRILKTNFKSPVEIDPFLREILEKIISAEKWTHLLIGMQIIFEGTALSLISHLLEVYQSPSLKKVLKVIEQDEGRHCSLGQRSLRLIETIPLKDVEDTAQWTAGILESLSYSLLSGQFYFLKEKYGLSEDRDLKVLKFYETREPFHRTYFKFVMPMLEKNKITSAQFQKRMKEAGILQ